MSEIVTSILLPASFVSDSTDIRQKTLKIGLVGRALAVFRVKKVCIFNDDEPNLRNQTSEAKTIELILSYMETPQYLRKMIFPHRDELRYAGLLYPLRTPHHPLQRERDKTGDYREGVVIKTGKRSILDVGLPEKAVVEQKLNSGRRLTVRLDKKTDGFVSAVPVSRGDVTEYWGYEIGLAKNLSEGLKIINAEYYIGTSRRGQNLYEAVNVIKSSINSGVAVAFGGPSAGLFEICERQGVDARELFDVVINTIPNQGTATVRTEEALVATLSLLNALIEG